MKNLSNASLEDTNKTARGELEKAGIICFESDFRALSGATVFGAVQFKHRKKVLTLQRSNASWMLRINAVFRSPEKDKFDGYASIGSSSMTFRREVESRIIIQSWMVTNQKKLLRLVNALARYYGGAVEVTATPDELYEKRLLSDYSPSE